MCSKTPSYLIILGTLPSLSVTQRSKSLTLALTLPQKTLQFYTLFCPPLTRKNKLTDSLFFEQFPDLLEYCNSLSGNSFILRELNFHYDCPLNSNTI